jgi:membrane protease YdiL (CAAX protease family)
MESDFYFQCWYVSVTAIRWEREHLRDFGRWQRLTFLFQIYCFLGSAYCGVRLHGTVPTRQPNLALGAFEPYSRLSRILTASGIEPPSSSGSQPASFTFLLPVFFTQMTWAAVFEEPLFRGFLWGYLRRVQWENGWIWLFQAILFTLGHVYYLQTEAIGPWFVRMMLTSLVIGFIAWRAKSIFASMVTHGMFNTSNDMLFHTRSLSEAVKVGGPRQLSPVNSQEYGL